MGRIGNVKPANPRLSLDHFAEGFGIALLSATTILQKGDQRFVALYDQLSTTLARMEKVMLA